IDYLKLAELVKKEDQENSGWISMLTHLVKKHEITSDALDEDNLEQPSLPEDQLDQE
ncbi:MAG: hypothetical protein HW386_1096, partial [Gammaproteobacteria bacterium]|nr:hypothetical protein [Gammaproteobacteria bacterium]